MAFPLTNYGSLIRGFSAVGRQAAAVSSPIVSIPRPKYTYLTLFEFEPTVDMSQFDDAYRTGRVLAATQSISHPQVNFTTENLRAYNAVRNVPVKIEYQPATITFYDDTTGVVANFLKLYRKFYHYSGDATRASDYGDRLGTAARDGSALPSIGMKSRANGRHFIRRITVFDLGTAPTGVNLYHFINPFVESITHDELSYYDASGFVNVSLSLQYEGYYEELNRNASDYDFIFEQFQDAARTFHALDSNANADRPDFFGGELTTKDRSIVGGVDPSIVKNMGPVLTDEYSTSGRLDLNKISTGGVTVSNGLSAIASLRGTAEDSEIGTENIFNGTASRLVKQARTTDGAEPYLNHTVEAGRSKRAVAAEEGEGGDRARDVMNVFQSPAFNKNTGGFNG